MMNRMVVITTVTALGTVPGRVLNVHPAAMLAVSAALGVIYLYAAPWLVAWVQQRWQPGTRASGAAGVAPQAVQAEQSTALTPLPLPANYDAAASQRFIDEVHDILIRQVTRSTGDVDSMLALSPVELDGFELKMAVLDALKTEPAACHAVRTDVVATLAMTTTELAEFATLARNAPLLAAILARKKPHGATGESRSKPRPRATYDPAITPNRRFVPIA